MRDYGKVSPQFWIGETGKKLRAAGSEAQVVSLYLMTCPHANMIGMYYLPKLYLSHETGLGIEGASKGLQRAIEAGFCVYDEASEVVWVIEMAKYQIADSLMATDKRCKGIQNEYDSLPENPFLTAFYDRYGPVFNMTNKRGANSVQTSPSEAPSKPLGSQEQEQEQEQENTNPIGLVVASIAADPPDPCPHKAIIALYHEILPTSPAIRDWTPARAEALRTRWKEDKSRQTLDWWRRFFQYISESEFLTGRISSGSRKPFCPGLEWICKAENFAKIREGRYHEDMAA